LQGKDLLNCILNSPRRNKLVVAAAGSGKTRLLIDVLVENIKRGKIDPQKDEVIVFTFTNNAADELAVRLTKLIGNRQDILNPIFIGTIHGWCNEYLKREGTLANTKVIDELEQYQLLIRIYNVLGLESNYEEPSKFQKIEKFVKDLELFYNENLDINDKIIPEKVRVCIKRYLDFIRRQRLLDFGSLIRRTTEHIRSSNKIKKYHLFVDEYQDVNLAQVKLFQALLSLHPESTLFAVGDPRQAIYQWRGGDIRRILNFSSDFDDTETFTMDMNHRSRRGIVEFANIVANDMDFSSYANSNVKIEPMVPNPERSDTGVSVIHENGRFHHGHMIVARIKELHERGIPYSNMAILMRSVVNHADEIMNLLDAENIPYYSPNKNAGIDFIQEFMGSIFKLMEILASDREPANRQEEEDLVQTITSCLETIRSYCRNTSIEEIHKAITEWYRELSIPARKKSGTTYYKNEAYNFRNQFFDFCKKVNFVLTQDNIELQDGFSAITQIMKAIEEIYRRRFLMTTGNPRDPPIDVFLKNLRWQLQHEIERWAETGMDISDSGERVTISTVHAAKGLEWPIVFVPFLWKYRFPVRKSSHGTSFPDAIANRYGTTIEDEKRLWYVAVTRARDRIYFYSGSIEGEREPSPFTYSIYLSKSPYMIETSSLNGSENLSTIEPCHRPVYLNIGVSDILILIECPFHFYLRRIKGVDVPVPQKFGAGNVVHRIIEHLLIDTNVTELEKLVEEEVYLPLAERYLEEKAKNKIRQKVQALVESGYLKDIQHSETPFKLLIGDIVVTGVVDALRIKNDGTEIIDWKYSVSERFRYRYENQIRIYAMGLKSKGYGVKKGLIYDLTKIANNSNEHTIEVDVSDEVIQELVEKAAQGFKALRNGEVLLRHDSKSCSICDVRRICPSHCAQRESG
jgi:DNA helicase-2/ATP-dependent DNA helicase PcrA